MQFVEKLLALHEKDKQQLYQHNAPAHALQLVQQFLARHHIPPDILPVIFSYST